MKKIEKKKIEKKKIELPRKYIEAIRFLKSLEGMSFEEGALELIKKYEKI